MDLAPKQRWSIKRATKRLNVWEGAVRSSKTWASIVRFIKYVMRSPKGDLVMMGKTQRTAYRNVIRPMEEMLGNEIKYSSGKGELDFAKRKIFIVGANDERAEGIIRGMTCAGAYCDEITLYPEAVWTMLLSRLSAPGAQLFGTTNTDSPNHWFKKKFLNRWKELDIAIFKFFLEDNPYLTLDYVSSLKKEYTGLWYKRFIESIWCIAEGAIYDFFDDKRPYILRYNELPKAKYKVVSADYGTGNPTTFGLFGINPFTMPKIWLEKEYYYDSRIAQKQKTDEEYAKDYLNFVGNNKVLYTIIDPSAASFKAQLRKEKIGSVLVDANNDVLDGIRTQSRMLKNGEYAICDRCTHAIEEYFGYVWDAKSQLIGIDKPVKSNDHAKDMERYALHTLYGGDFINYEELTEM